MPIARKRVFLCGECEHLGMMSDGYPLPASYPNFCYNCLADSAWIFPRFVDIWEGE